MPRLVLIPVRKTEESKMEEIETRQCDRGETAIRKRPEMCPSAAHELLERLRRLFEAHARRPKVSLFIGDPT